MRHWRFSAQKSEPELDLTRNFGAITKYGLVDFKKQLWKCQNFRGTPLTHYQETFVSPDHENYNFKRHSMPA